MIEVLGWDWKAVQGSKLALLPLDLCYAPPSSEFQGSFA